MITLRRQTAGMLLLAAALCTASLAADTQSTPTADLERGDFDFEGRQLAYFCTGAGAPTLILEAPSGVPNEEAFAEVLPALAERGRVCAYERAYYGDSDPLPAGEIQTVSDYAAELGTFLSLGDIEPPFVLVGFSYGGFVSRYYTGYNPDDVVGMVLIDTPHVRWLRQMKAELSAADWAKVQDIISWFIENRGHDVWRSQFEVEAAPPLPDDLPVAVITRGQDHERMRLSGISEAGFRIYNDVHFRLAPELEQLTGQTVGFIAAESHHMIPDAQPDVVVRAVDSVLSSLNRNETK